MSRLLTFNDLRQANTKRLPKFKNRKGQTVHTQEDGSDWTLAQWSNACLGELGEAANVIKKVDRGDLTLEEARVDLGKEFADTLIYLEILSHRAGVNLADAVIQKWNEVSERIGFPYRLSHTHGLQSLSEQDSVKNEQDYLLEADETHISEAKAAGLTVVNATDCQLQIDIDSPELPKQFREVHDMLLEQQIIGYVDERHVRSKSGNWHVIIDMDKPLPAAERILLQLLLGSDPVRELLNYRRVLNGVENPIRLFMTQPDAKSIYAPASVDDYAAQVTADLESMFGDDDAL